MTRTQYLQTRGDEAIVIETPEGLIRIEWVVASTRRRVLGKNRATRRKLRISLPEKMRAFIGEERALEHARFVRRNGDGQLRPRYRLLTPILDAAGHLVGVSSSDMLRIGGQ